ncbi:MAG: NapC/NirT family cytochrome c [Verrucomicrobia subdivision 3 bacterium]|nr:NapC/NirT family cytochrome c [Limisphaerales bacterium]
MASEPSPSNQRRRYYRNWLSLTGFVLIASSLFAFFFLFMLDLFAPGQSPYIGILTYLVAPIFFLLGVVLWLWGWLVQRRQATHALAGAPPTRFTIDLSRQRDRRLLVGFAIGAALFLLITAVGSYETYHATKSVQFCGQACHGPMKPEYVAYLNSPHARVSCVDCHVGSGASAYVASKVNGINQLYCTITGKIERPIKTPVKNLRPAQETCEQCHWPLRNVGNLDRTYAHFLADETNTPFAVRLSLKVGGGDPNHGPVGGIHWHMNLANKVEYIATDDKRQSIPWVRFTDSNGAVTEYRVADFKDDPARHSIRTMDCMDCHNRPAHHFLAPNDAVDRAIEAGRIDRALPWVKSNVVAALVQPYLDEEQALQKIEETLQAKYSGAPQLAGLVTEAKAIFARNFFPEMKADWRAYPDNIGHKDWGGCFRCHDGLHKTSDGKRSIAASDCNSCHTILAQGSGAQLENLSAKGHTFFHIDAPNEDFSCNNCHTGAFPKE